MPCFYCGKRVSLVRQMNDPDFCCDEHRARYHDLTRLALGRLLETREQLAPAAPKRRSRSKSAEPARTHRPAQPAPETEPEIEELRPEPLAEYDRGDSPVMPASNGSRQQTVSHVSVFLPETPPEEADLDPTLVAFVWNNPLGAADDRDLRCEKGAEAFAAPLTGTEFPRSSDPAGGGFFPTGSFRASPPQNRFERRVEFRETELPFECVPAPVFPATPGPTAMRVPDQAGPAPALRPDPSPAARVYASATAWFPAVPAACPSAAAQGPVFSSQAAFQKAEPPRVIAPAATNARVEPELRFAFEPALPQAEINARIQAAFTSETELRSMWTPQAVPPATARTRAALGAIPIAPAALSLPAPAAPIFAATVIDAADFVSPGAVITPKPPAPAERRSDAALGPADKAPEIPAFSASPAVRVLTAAPGLPWMAQPRGNAQVVRPLPAPAAAEPSGPAWPTVAITRVAVPPPCGAASTWVAQPLRDQRTSERKPAAAAFGAVVPGIPDAASFGPAGRAIAAIGLLPMAARPGVQQGEPARLRVSAAPEIAGPEPGMPFLSAPPAPGGLSGYDIPRVDVARTVDVQAAYRANLQPAPVSLTEPLPLPAAAARGVCCRGLDQPLRFIPPVALTARTLTPAPSITPAELPAAFPMSPQSDAVAPRCKLGRTSAIPYCIPAAGKRAKAAATGFADAPLAPALPGAAALAAVPALAACGALPKLATPARIISNPVASGWEAAPAAARLPLAPAAIAARGVQQASGVFPIAAPSATAQKAGLRAGAFAAFAEPGTLRPQSADFTPGLTSALLWKFGQPAPESRRAAAVAHISPAPPVRKMSRRALIPGICSAVVRAHMPTGIFRPLEVPDFDDDSTARTGAGYPAQASGPAIPAFRFGPECADRPRTAAFVPAQIAPALGRTANPWAGAPFLPGAVILPRPATLLIEFDFYAIAAAPRERGWSFVSSVFRVVLFCMALPPATQPPGAQPPAAGFEKLNTPAVERVVSDRAAAVLDITARLTHE